MRPSILAVPTLVLSLAVAVPAAAQPAGFADEWRGQFEASAQKLVALAQAIPASAYDWRPAEGVASVAEVFMHIARYNYAYPDQNMGYPAPPLFDYEELQGVVNEKEPAVEILAASMDHVREVADAMEPAEWSEETTLYGREVARWAVLLQLVTHMNEHLGQSIAYARMNGVVPPWSR